MTRSKAFRSMYFFISLGITGDQSNLRRESGNSNSFVCQDFFHRDQCYKLDQEHLHHNDVIIPVPFTKKVRVSNSSI